MAIVTQTSNTSNKTCDNCKLKLTDVSLTYLLTGHNETYCNICAKAYLYKKIKSYIDLLTNLN